ncbi:hypothetical protein EC988_000541 [Linderina pennispora]|nr:hypothetical protein EC988_000541 [Linderina pennispora]
MSVLGRGASWPRNNWTENETREVMEILVSEFVNSNFNTVAYSKSRAADARFEDLSFKRPARELYNKVQNLRQRFFTPHGYLLRWASPSTDERNRKRCEKGLSNNKTRESIHGIFGSDPHAAAAALAEADDLAVASGAAGGNDGSGGLSEKSVHYYSDIFRRRAPEVWSQSLEAYKQFAAIPEYMATVSTASSRAVDIVRTRSRTQVIQQPSLSDQQQFHDMLSSPAMSLASTVLHTPSTALMSDFSTTDGGVDAVDEYSPYILQAVVGHSWHKFLCDRNRWVSLGLMYADELDWETQEAEFLTQHLISMVEFVSNVNEIPLMLVSSHTGSFDANSILQAVAQADTMLTVSLSNLSSDIHQCLQYVERGGHYTMLSLCLLADRQMQSAPSLALLVSRGDSSNRFGTYPHHDPMLSRLAANNDAMWHEFSLAGSGLVPAELQPQGFPPARRQSEDNSMAFTYIENGYKYAFFSRRCGHFFEMKRCDDWAPAISSTLLRPIWSSRIATRDHLVTRLREDNEKILHGMVELFGLRPFCAGFFDGIAFAGNARGAPPKGRRRTSDDPNCKYA